MKRLLNYVSLSQTHSVHIKKRLLSDISVCMKDKIRLECNICQFTDRNICLLVASTCTVSYYMFID